MLVKCKSCDTKIERNIAYKTQVNGVNWYYCNEEEYIKERDELKKRKAVKDNVYLSIYEIFGYEVTNSRLYKEVYELSEVYGYELIRSYIAENNKYLEEALQKKSFKNEYNKIRYFAAILKNCLVDYKVNNKTEVIKITEQEFTESIFKAKKRKKSILEFESEDGDEV